MHDLLCEKRELRCFRSAVPLVRHIQKSAMLRRKSVRIRTDNPGEAGSAFRDIAIELLSRIREPRSRATSSVLVKVKAEDKDA